LGGKTQRKRRKWVLSCLPIKKENVRGKKDQVGNMFLHKGGNKRWVVLCTTAIPRGLLGMGGTGGGEGGKKKLWKLCFVPEGKQEKNQIHGDQRVGKTRHVGHALRTTEKEGEVKGKGGSAPH